jgi:hypothetical protein
MKTLKVWLALCVPLDTPVKCDLNYRGHSNEMASNGRQLYVGYCLTVYPHIVVFSVR